jgi:hypothetical protein
MKRLLASFAILTIIIGMLMIAGCDKTTSTPCPVCPGSGVATYKVTATVLGPSGAPLGGATLALVNPPNQTGTFSTLTDSTGKGTIDAPAGPQQLTATLGIFQATINVTVLVNTTNIPQTVGTVKLQQNTALGKTLVIFAGCEQIQDVLADTSIAYLTFDHTTVDSMRIRVALDSVAVLNYLKQYGIVFSDCDCGYEIGYPLLARVYGQYVRQGGRIYGGHYNYMNLQYIVPPYYQTEVYGSGDSLKIINTNLSTALGYTVIQFPGYFGNYEQWSDLPGSSTTTVYAVMASSPGSPSSPQGIPIIVENRIGTGKYLWTVYHNQDILSDPRLIRIVRYFLYSMAQ